MASKGLSHEERVRRAEVRIANKHFPRRDVRKLLVDMLHGDEGAAAVLNDYCLENAIEGGSAKLHWELLQPTPYQRKTMIAIINRATTRANWPTLIAENGEAYESVFREAGRQLAIHKHAPYARVVTPHAMTTAYGPEIVLDLHYHQKGEAWRCRCATDECMPVSVGLARKPFMPNGTEALFGEEVDRV